MYYSFMNTHTRTHTLTFSIVSALFEFYALLVSKSNLYLAQSAHLNVQRLPQKVLRVVGVYKHTHVTYTDMHINIINKEKVFVVVSFVQFKRTVVIFPKRNINKVVVLKRVGLAMQKRAPVKTDIKSRVRDPWKLFRD